LKLTSQGDRDPTDLIPPLVKKEACRGRRNSNCDFRENLKNRLPRQRTPILKKNAHFSKEARTSLKDEIKARRAGKNMEVRPRPEAGKAGALPFLEKTKKTVHSAILVRQSLWGERMNWERRSSVEQRKGDLTKRNDSAFPSMGNSWSLGPYVSDHRQAGVQDQPRQSQKKQKGKKEVEASCQAT